MNILKHSIVAIVAGIALIPLPQGSYADSYHKSNTASKESRSATTQRIAARTETKPPEPKRSAATRHVENAVIHPYRSCNVAAQVSGVIERFPYEPGRLLRGGQTVLEIWEEPYNLAVQAATKRVKVRKLALKLAEGRVSQRRELLSQDWTTRQKLVEAEQQVAIERARLEEAKELLQAAELERKACDIGAPFGGYLAVKYKEPFESVEAFEKVFLIIDTRKVYAVAQVPVDLLTALREGSKGMFEVASGGQYTGEIANIGPLVNPASKTARVWMLLDNSKGDLKVGMTGSLKF